MARKHSQPRPAGKSKTGLRRGHFTPGTIPPKKTARTPARAGMGTTRDEEAMLFGEPLEGAK
jgi:hypothetical protein